MAPVHPLREGEESPEMGSAAAAAAAVEEQPVHIVPLVRTPVARSAEAFRTSPRECQSSLESRDGVQDCTSSLAVAVAPEEEMIDARYELGTAGIAGVAVAVVVAAATRQMKAGAAVKPSAEDEQLQQQVEVVFVAGEPVTYARNQRKSHHTHNQNTYRMPLIFDLVRLGWHLTRKAEHIILQVLFVVDLQHHVSERLWSALAIGYSIDGRHAQTVIEQEGLGERSYDR